MLKTIRHFVLAADAQDLHSQNQLTSTELDSKNMHAAGSSDTKQSKTTVNRQTTGSKQLTGWTQHTMRDFTF